MKEVVASLSIFFLISTVIVLLLVVSLWRDEPDLAALSDEYAGKRLKPPTGSKIDR